ncbi:MULTISPECIES: ROK family protein [Olivibacter]|uniref:ROK family protein n=2 Tax=Olivibacter TaxID=376469 RepID=A0ABV6HHK0_9SPHI|nr:MULTISPECIES: ROK family protein [Olivibacter]MCL4641144.1 ROK family protein [Olivibacter sp. UJ_SKK_5.1]MDM8176547.1 ROK family protein [Olivibacter sp. 47]MDX3915994.1 ROK family protein [Pseudosphingobacterium sp.]QEL00809.1 ROK family protein [Olivibacter sp. LS-1]
MTAKILKQQHLRKAILRQLYYNGALSLADLCTMTSKSLPVVSSSVLALLEERYIVEYGLAPSTGGRRPITYLLNREKNSFILAVAVDQLETRICIFNLGNELVQPIKSFRLEISQNPIAIDNLVACIKQVLTESKLPADQILGVGIAMPGVYNMKEGINHTFFPDHQHLPKHLSRKLGLPVYVDNDSRAIAMAELNFGTAKGYKDVMVVNIGWGIGLGMIVDGALFSGHNGYAGEFSHIPLANSNNLCSCGKRGCLEVDASLLVLVEKAKREMMIGAKSKLEQLFQDDHNLSGEHLLNAARSGDPLAVSLLAEGGFMIGKGLATLIHIMNPERIVLSGRGAAAGKIWLAPIHQAINEFCIPRLSEQTTIAVSDLSKEVQLLGAAALVVEQCDF